MPGEWNDKIFGVQAGNFEALALDIFRYQAAGNPVYRDFCAALRVDPARVSRLAEIPFLPIRFFRTHPVLTGQVPVLTGQAPALTGQAPALTGQVRVLTGQVPVLTGQAPGQTGQEEAQQVFESSGTTGMVTSRHYVTDTSIYEESFLRSFAQFYGDIKEWRIIGLLPSYLERGNSSLVYMTDRLIRESGDPKSGFYLHEFAQLADLLKEGEAQQKKTLLIGVTFALLDFAEQYPMPLQHTVIMETGGMKGRRVEITRPEVHDVLTKAFGVPSIHSEYGMTELLSQAWSRGEGLFECPIWMKIVVRDEEDPLSLKWIDDSGELIMRTNKHFVSGAINVIDLANVNSCSFIATDDAGKLYADGSFEVLGRLDGSDMRGCSLLVVS